MQKNPLNKPLALQQFTTQCLRFAQTIKEKRSELIKLLSAYEPQDTAKDEIDRAISTLEGAKDEFSSIKKPLSNLTIATFFPLNLPLYSLVLFAIMPSAFADSVFLRPPEVMHDMLQKLWDFLDIDTIFPNISLKNVPRHIFLQLYASESDAIIFTGKYENALTIHKACPQSLLIYNGSGVNPILLCEDADIAFAVAKSVEMRCFNSGQDCAGPDAFFVPNKLMEEFIAQLKSHLTKTAHVGNSSDPLTTIGPTMKQSYIAELKAWQSAHKNNIVFGGEIDEANNLVHPTIAVSSVKAQDGKVFHEFFAPFFYVLSYDNDKELKQILSFPSFTERGMYISIFGNNPEIEKNLTAVRILKNKIVNDVEQGNTAYGGYGDKANFILWQGEKTVRPILISRELHIMLKPQ